MAVFFVAVIFAGLPCHSATPPAEKAPFEKAIAAAPCPDDPGLWCVAVAMPQNPGFYVESATGMIAYRLSTQSVIRVEKVTVVFPKDLDKWQEEFTRRKVTEEALVLAAYNNETLPEEVNLRLGTKYHGLNFTDTLGIIAHKKTGSTIYLYTANKTQVDWSPWLLGTFVFFLYGFFAFGLHSGNLGATRRKFSNLGITIPRSYLWLYRPSQGLANGPLIMGSGIVTAVSFALVVLAAGGVSWITFVVSCLALLFAVHAGSWCGSADEIERRDAAFWRHDAQSGGQYRAKMFRYRKRSSASAFAAAALLIVSLFTVGGSEFASYLPWIAVVIWFGIGFGCIWSRIGLRKQKIAGVSEKA